MLSPPSPFRTALRRAIFSSMRTTTSADVAPASPANPSSFVPSQNARAFAFSGIHILSPRIFSFMQEEGTFSVIPMYLRLAGQMELILGFRADQYYWRD